MVWSVHVILILLALLFIILSICGKCPLWISVLLIVIDQLVGSWGSWPGPR